MAVGNDVLMLAAIELNDSFLPPPPPLFTPFSRVVAGRNSDGSRGKSDGSRGENGPKRPFQFVIKGD